MLKWVLLIIAAYRLLGYQSNQVIEKIQVDFDDIGIQNIKLFESTLDLVLRITNVNQIPLFITGLTGIMSYGGTTFANFTTSSSITIPAMQSARLSLKVLVDNATFLGQLAEAIETQGPIEPVVISGFIDVKGLKIPFERQLNIRF